MTHHYTECGLDYVYLVNGFTIHDTAYGSGVSIDNADELHAAIAHSVIERPYAIRGQELRFLRSMLDVSQTGLGGVLGVSRTTVARWEGEPDQPVAPGADRALRLYFAVKKDKADTARNIADMLDSIHEAEERSATFEESDQGWLQAA